MPKASDPRIATIPTLDSPFIKQLCKCLRTGQSTGAMQNIARHSAMLFDEAPYELRALEVALATVTNALDGVRACCCCCWGPADVLLSTRAAPTLTSCGDPC